MIKRRSVTNVDFVKLITTNANIPVDNVFKLYYNKDSGKPIAYSMEELEGDFIIITKEQYAESKPDVIVQDKKIVHMASINYVRKLIPSESGVACIASNVLIVDHNSHSRWKMKTTISS